MTVTYPVVTHGDDTAYSGPDGVGFEFGTRVVTGPPPPPPRTALLGSGDQSAFAGFRLGAHRSYTGLGEAPARIAAILDADAAAFRYSIVSIGRSGPNDPYHEWPTFDVSAASAFLGALTHNAGRTILIPNHEPETHQGTPRLYTAWADAFVNYFRSRLTGILYAPCLMAWTGRNGLTGFDPWMPSVPLDVFGIDGYAHASGTSAAGVFGNALTYARSKALPVLICETGMDKTADQVGYLATLDAFVSGNPDVLGACYWNGGATSATGHDYHLTAAGLAAFQAMADKPLYASARFGAV